MTAVAVISKDELMLMLEDSARRGALMALKELKATVSRTELTEDEAAEILLLSPNTLRTWRCRGIGPKYIKSGRKILYPRESLEAWKLSNRNETAQSIDCASIADTILNRQQEARCGTER